MPPAEPTSRDSLLRSAVLRSERRRILATMGVLVAIVPLVAYRLVNPINDSRLGPYIGLGLIAIFWFYHAGMLRVLARHLRDATDLSPRAWFASAVVEGVMPVLGLAVGVYTSGENPYATLLGPAIGFSYIVILASVLRLSPPLALASGMATLAAYVFLMGAVFFNYPYEQSRVFPLITYGVSCFMLLLATIAAAFVADESRKHVVAAAREEQVKQERDKFAANLKVAQAIQQGLFPASSPKLDDYQFAALCEPADETGGDSYDWLSLSPSRVLVSIADVTGHGIGPALVTTATRAYVRASAHGAPAPREILARLNALLHEDIAPTRFVTLALLDLDAGAHRATLLSAGHGPLLIWSARTRELRAVPAQGPPLALAPEIELDPAIEVEFGAGDTVILVSDGVLEWRNASGQDFGVDRIRGILERKGDAPAQEILSAIKAELRDFGAGTVQRDDVTAVVIRRAR